MCFSWTIYLRDIGQKEVKGGVKGGVTRGVCFVRRKMFAYATKSKHPAPPRHRLNLVREDTSDLPFPASPSHRGRGTVVCLR